MTGCTGLLEQNPATEYFVSCGEKEFFRPFWHSGVIVALGYSHTKIMLAADLRILPMHFNEKVVDFLRNPQMADS